MIQLHDRNAKKYTNHTIIIYSIITKSKLTLGKYLTLFYHVCYNDIVKYI